MQNIGRYGFFRLRRTRTGMVLGNVDFPVQDMLKTFI